MSSDSPADLDGIQHLRRILDISGKAIYESLLSADLDPLLQACDDLGAESVLMAHYVILAGIVEHAINSNTNPDIHDNVVIAHTMSQFIALAERSIENQAIDIIFGDFLS